MRKLIRFVPAPARRLAKAVLTRAGVVRPAPQVTTAGGIGSGLAVEALRAGGSETQLPKDEATRNALLAGRFVHPRFGDHAEHQTPPPGTVFLTVCNDKYAPGLEALLLSLLKVYPDLDARFLVLHDGGLSGLSQARLASMYAKVEFSERDPSKYSVTLGDHYNHRRIGLLGYLTVDGLALEDASWLIILDTDLLVLGDISPLWSGSTIKAVPDAGRWPFAVVSERTGRPVLNSGVLAFPRSELGPDAVARARAVLELVNEENDPDLAKFADQKFWNLYLADREVELLPQNFNTIKTLVTKYRPEELGSVKILHLTGSKPWYAFTNEDVLDDADRSRFKREKRESRDAFTLWTQLYRSELAASRMRSFRKETGPRLEALRGRLDDTPAVMMGNGPSLARTDLSAFADFERFAFNWFVLHEEFDEIAPHHLILPSHMFFGGWHTPRPAIPDSFMEALLGKTHRPHLWISYYFKPFIETIPELQDFEIDYFLFEKPLKRRVSDAGHVELDMYSPLTDCNTGVLTAGIPLAVHMGTKRIVLVGCDSNYSSTSGSYFYPAAAHSSRTTRSDTLLSTWQADGPGAFGYTVMQRELTERGVQLHDATLDGNLRMLPRITLDEARLLPATLAR